MMFGFTNLIVFRYHVYQEIWAAPLPEIVIKVTPYAQPSLMFPFPSTLDCQKGCWFNVIEAHAMAWTVMFLSNHVASGK